MQGGNQARSLWEASWKLQTQYLRWQTLLPHISVLADTISGKYLDRDSHQELLMTPINISVNLIHIRDTHQLSSNNGNSVILWVIKESSSEVDVWVDPPRDFLKIHLYLFRGFEFYVVEIIIIASTSHLWYYQYLFVELWHPNK